MTFLFLIVLLDTDYYRARQEISEYHVMSKFNYVSGETEEVIWNPLVRNVYIGTTIMKLIFEIFFIHNVYILQRIQNNADQPVDENMLETEPLKFSQVWLSPDRYHCRLGEVAHSACNQVGFASLRSEGLIWS